MSVVLRGGCNADVGFNAAVWCPQLQQRTVPMFPAALSHRKTVNNSHTLWHNISSKNPAESKQPLNNNSRLRECLMASLFCPLSPPKNLPPSSLFRACVGTGTRLHSALDAWPVWKESSRQ